MRTVGSMGSLSISAPLSANFGYLPEDFYPPGIRERFVALLERVKVFKFLFSCWRRPAMVIFMLKQLAARVFAREGLEEFTFWYGRLQKSLHAETGEAPCSSTGPRCTVSGASTSTRLLVSTSRTPSPNRRNITVLQV